MSFDSFSFNFLGGKIMVRNLRYANTDYSVTVNDGYIIFRWWLPHPIGMIEMLSRSYDRFWKHGRLFLRVGLIIVSDFRLLGTVTLKN